ncbi:MAG: cation transporter, partial [Orrella sp.]
MGSNHYHRKSDKDQDIAGAQSSYTAAQRGAVAKQTTLVSVAVNIVLSTLQIVVGYFARSQALIADGIHSLSDLLSDFVVLVANH